MGLGKLFIKNKLPFALRKMHENMNTIPAQYVIKKQLNLIRNNNLENRLHCYTTVLTT